MKAKHKRLFSNCIIVYCIAYMSVYLWRCLDVLQATSINPTQCVIGAVTFFGGELLAVCLAYIFGKRGNAKQDTKTTAVNDDVDCTI